MTRRPFIAGNWKMNLTLARAEALSAQLAAVARDVAASVDVAEASVSQVLRVLRTAGVVENRREGRMVYYRLADGHVRMLLDVSREHARHEGQG